MLGFQAIAFPNAEQIDPQHCALVAIDSWNYYFGEQGLTTRHLPLKGCLK